MMCMEQQNYIRSRVLGREVADVALGLARDEVRILGPVSKQAFWERLFEQSTFEQLALASPPKPKFESDTNQPMNDAQARAFGSLGMPYGKHADTRIDEVPISYLQMLVDDDEFKKKLRRYLASPRIKAELERA